MPAKDLMKSRAKVRASMNMKSISKVRDGFISNKHKKTQAKKEPLFEWTPGKRCEADINVKSK
jgi:hypothetical protein